jgi:hypothetical protein
MSRSGARLATAAAVVSLLSSTHSGAQLLAPAQKAQKVTITEPPTLEIAHDDTAIIRWTETNPGGADEHFAVVNYGTERKALTQTAKSSIRLNRAHAKTIFRVRMYNLQPSTTYYYTVTTTEADGTTDGVQSSVEQFTMPASGQRFVHYPQPVK